MCVALPSLPRHPEWPVCPKSPIPGLHIAATRGWNICGQDVSTGPAEDWRQGVNKPPRFAGKCQRMNGASPSTISDEPTLPCHKPNCPPTKAREQNRSPHDEVCSQTNEPVAVAQRGRGAYPLLPGGWDHPEMARCPDDLSSTNIQS